MEEPINAPRRKTERSYINIEETFRINKEIRESKKDEES